MKSLNHFILGLFMLSAVSGVVNAKEWRGIVPLHSTFEDVEKLLGKTTYGPRIRSIYETEEERIFLRYQSTDNACGKGFDFFNVPPLTVIDIQVEPKKKPLLTDLNLDMRKFIPYSTCIGATGYSNREEGFEMHVYGDDVSTFYYYPNETDRKQFACSNTNK